MPTAIASCSSLGPPRTGRSRWPRRSPGSPTRTGIRRPPIPARRGTVEVGGLRLTEVSSP